MRRLGRFAEGVLEAGWLAVVVLVPLFIDKNASEVFEPAKAGVLRALAVLMLVAWIVKALSSSSRHAAGPASPTSRLAELARVPLVLPTVFLLATTLLSTVLSIAPAESFYGHLGRAQGACTLLAYVSIFAATASNLTPGPQVRRLVTGLILPSLPIALYAVFQRLSLEPLQVIMRETEIQRATSLLGQPVFLAAYLGMIMPFTALRVVASLRRPRRPLAASLYAGILLLQGAAALFSESRGPLVGLAGAAMVAILTVAAKRRARLPVVAVAVCAALFGAFLMFGLPARYLGANAGGERERIARRASETFEVTGGGGQFRATNWEVAERVSRNREALEFADGTRDARALVRPLVGYGPEVQYAISPPFYDAELTRLFGYFLADRYHNDLWDLLNTTGVLGLFAWLALQSTLLWYVVVSLGVVHSTSRRRLFWGTYAGGALVGALGWTLARGLAFAFLGLQTGAMLGIGAFMAILTLAPRAREEAVEPGREAGHDGLLVAGLAALVSHLIETQFSFTVIATGALFWIVCALVVVLVVLPSRAEAPDVARDTAPAASGAVADGALLGLSMIALGFAFLGGPTMPRRPGTVLWDGLTFLSRPEGERFPVVAILAVATLLGGALVLAVERRGAWSEPGGVMPALRTLAVGVGVTFVYWLRLAFILAERAVPVRERALVVAQNLAIREAATRSFYLFSLVVLLVFAWAARSAQAKVAVEVERPLPGWRLALAAAAAMLGLVAVSHVALSAATAEAAAALGDALGAQDQMVLAEEAYQRAATERSESDAYQALLAKAYAKHARLEPRRAGDWLKRADEALGEAIARNPIATEHATNRAVIRGHWAQRGAEAERAALRASVAELYARALRLNPQDPDVWRLWASAQLGVLQDPTGALASARRAVALDPRNADAYVQLAESQVGVARTQAGDARRAGFLEAAVNYGKAIALFPHQPTYRVGEGKAYLEAGQPSKAVTSLRSALSSLPAASPARKSAAAALKRAESALALVTAPPGDAP